MASGRTGRTAARRAVNAGGRRKAAVRRADGDQLRWLRRFRRAKAQLASRTHIVRTCDRTAMQYRCSCMYRARCTSRTGRCCATADHSRSKTPCSRSAGRVGKAQGLLECVRDQRQNLYLTRARIWGVATKLEAIDAEVAVRDERMCG